MIAILTVFHIMITLAMVGVILIQRSEGGGLGIGGGGVMSGRGTANILTRATTILAALFMITSLALTLIATGGGRPRSFMGPAGTPAPIQAPAAPAAPAGPSAPVK